MRETLLNGFVYKSVVLMSYFELARSFMHPRLLLTANCNFPIAWIFPGLDRSSNSGTPNLYKAAHILVTDVGDINDAVIMTVFIFVDIQLFVDFRKSVDI